MTKAYRIVLVHHGLEEFAAEVEKSIVEAAGRLSAVARLVEVCGGLSEESTTQVVAYLANEEGRDDKTLAETIRTALERDVPILPIVGQEQSDHIGSLLPEAITHLNATVWRAPGANVTTSLLGMLGLVETERKVFISYRRSETNALAEQLHTELVQRRFDVFLDRFSVEPGADFQRRLQEDLRDKAFVLLLESSGLRESKWVRHEIAYAHARRIQMLALTLPDTDRKSQERAIDDAFRRHLSQHDVLPNGTLAPDALRKTLDTIEFAHARALRRRREQILGSVTEKLRVDGCTCHRADDWCVLATGVNGEAELFWVTPRRPEPGDFYSLSRQHRRMTEAGRFTALKASVVHESDPLDEGHRELLEWLASVSGRELASVGTCSV